MGADRASSSNRRAGGGASGRSPRHQWHRACVEKWLPLVRLPARIWSSKLREELDEHYTKPVIPNRSNRKEPFTFNKRLYKLRWRIEAAFNRLKDFRRIATRYDKLARNYLASVCLVAAVVWWI